MMRKVRSRKRKLKRLKSLGQGKDQELLLQAQDPVLEVNKQPSRRKLRNYSNIPQISSMSK